MFRSLVASVVSALRPARKPTPKPQKPKFRPRCEQLEDRAVPARLPTGFSETVVGRDLVRPTAFELAQDGRIFVAEQDGALRVISNNVMQQAPVLKLTVDGQGERGLLGVTTDPRFGLDNHFIYLYYTVPGQQAHNRVSRFTLNGNAVVPGSERILMELPPLGPTNHNGGALHFKDDKLYIAVGDGALPNIDPMATNTRFGKLLRINADGSIPTDNPFYTTARNDNPADPGDKRSIWAVGLRNPFTFAVQRSLGRIFVNDVGQATWEEINDATAPGRNFGWRSTEGPTNAPGITSPLHYYTHGSGTFQGNAIVGGAFYNPARQNFPRQFNGTYFYGDLTSGWINVVNPRTGASSQLATGIVYPVDLRVSYHGHLYYLARGGRDGAGIVSRIQFGPTDISSAGGGIGAVPTTVGANVPFKVTRTYSLSGTPFAYDYQIRYVASQDAVLGNADDVFAGLETVTAPVGKRPGTTSGYSPVLRISRPGRWYVFAMLDWGNAIPETNEANNLLRTRGQITVT